VLYKAARKHEYNSSIGVVCLQRRRISAGVQGTGVVQLCRSTGTVQEYRLQNSWGTAVVQDYRSITGVQRYSARVLENYRILTGV